MDTKKISFGFNKNAKHSTLLPLKKASKDENKVELIKCVEGKEIKLVEEKEKEIPIIIPIGNSNGNASLVLQNLIKIRCSTIEKCKGRESGIKIIKPQNNDPNINISCDTDTLDHRAAQELLDELQDNHESKKSNKFVLPLLKANNLPLNGAKESTLDDYNSIPIEQYGFAMLRGMGWVQPLKKEESSEPIVDSVIVRPKGMGLGADTALQKKPLLVTPETNDVLTIKRNAYVCILGGKYKDLYGQIEGFDDYAGRVIVKMAIGGNKLAFSEFLCQPVPRKEYIEYGKCINKTKYEEFNLDNECNKDLIKKEKSSINKESFDNNSDASVQNFTPNDRSCYNVNVKKKDKTLTSGCSSYNVKNYTNDYGKPSCSLNTTMSKLDSRRHQGARSSRSHEHHSHHRRKRRYTSSSSSTTSASSYYEKREISKRNSKCNHKYTRRNHKKYFNSNTSSSSSSSSDSNREKNHRNRKKQSRKNYKRQ